MKTLILSFFILVNFSCDNADENSTSQTQSPILGQWKVTKYEPGFSPTANYSGEEIKWTFNNDNTVSVVIISGTTTNPTMPLNTTGTFQYVINSTNAITLNDIIYYYSIQGNELIIRTEIDVSADGKKLTFAKIQ